MTTQPKDLMTLEETAGALSLHCKKLARSSVPHNVSMHRLLTSALHHLEAGRKGCECEQMIKAVSPEGCVDFPEELIFNYGDGLRISAHYPPISFCPWCGGKVSTAQEVKE